MKGRVAAVVAIIMVAWWLNRVGTLAFQRYVIVVMFAVEMMIGFAAGWVARKGYETKHGQYRSN